MERFFQASVVAIYDVLLTSVNPSIYRAPAVKCNGRLAWRPSTPANSDVLKFFLTSVPLCFAEIMLLNCGPNCIQSRLTSLYSSNTGTSSDTVLTETEGVV